VVEGAKEIREICEEYADVFKLPGDMLTATTAAQHSIPTPSVPEGRAITLRNYRLPESQQKEVREQIDQMLKEEIIIPSRREWNFQLIVVPKKPGASKEKMEDLHRFQKVKRSHGRGQLPLTEYTRYFGQVG
jgi:hypothetical protein